jgi:hypothetical protein
MVLNAIGSYSGSRYLSLLPTGNPVALALQSPVYFFISADY